MHVLAGRKAKVNAVGILGLVENMPDGNAQRPGDVVTSMSGQTIEVINTDAEGRLVLADAALVLPGPLQAEVHGRPGDPDRGDHHRARATTTPACYANDEELADNLLAAAAKAGEPLWRMPLPAQYDKNIDSMIADMKNTGGRPGGSITAALFIQRFVNGVPWAHLDIASHRLEEAARRSRPSRTAPRALACGC